MIISASRRSDIPCYYSEWLLNRLTEGSVLIPNPRNAGRLGRVALSPEHVDCIVFWTKNPEPMLEKLPRIDELGHQYYFEFTITAYGKEVERNLPEKQAVIDTFRRLADRLGPARVDWRFDPIMKAAPALNDGSFSAEWIAERFSELCRQLYDHTERCIISFVDEYSHTRNREAVLSGSEMRQTAGLIAEVAAQYRLPVFSCAEEIDLGGLGINHAACIDGQKIGRLTGTPLAAKKDTGQRPACGCIESVDIGAYDTCENGCAYCYAVTSPGTLAHRARGHDPRSPLLTGWPKGTELITDRTLPSLRVDQISLFEKEILL
jgi:hypothetical protein